MAGLLNDPVTLGFLVLILGFILFMYLFVRRIITGFADGFREGKR